MSGKKRIGKAVFRMILVILWLLIISGFTSAQSEPVAYYPFSGNANDASGNGNNGTVYGATLATDRFENLNSAYSFDSTTSYIEIPNSSTLSLDNLQNGYTISAWIKPSILLVGEVSVPLPPSISIGAENIVNKYGYFELATTCFASNISEVHYGLHAFHTTDTQGILVSNHFTSNVPSFSTGPWYHVAVTWDGTIQELAVWANGNSNTFGKNRPRTDPTPRIDGPVSIGGTKLDSPQFFIDEVKIWDRPLSADEIMELYNNAPVAWDDDFPTDEDTLLTTTTPGVLYNDTADNTNLLSVVGIDTTGTIGLVGYSPDGGFTYDPTGGFDSLAPGDTATDTFTYTITDGVGRTSSATVTITVTGVNDAPEIPSQLLCDGEVNPDNVNDYTPLFSWTFSDVDNTIPVAFQIQIRNASNLLVYDATHDSSSSTSVEGPAGLSPNEEYSWAVQVWDQDESSGFSPPATFIILDIGLRAFDGTQIIKIAVDHLSTDYELRIHRDGTTYGIILVDLSDPYASNIRIQTNTGMKAIKKMR